MLKLQGHLSFSHQSFLKIRFMLKDPSLHFFSFKKKKRAQVQFLLHQNERTLYPRLESQM